MFQNLWQPFKLLPIFGGLAYAVSPLVPKEDDYVTTSDMSTIAAPTVKEVSKAIYDQPKYWSAVMKSKRNEQIGNGTPFLGPDGISFASMNNGPSFANGNGVTMYYVTARTSRDTVWLYLTSLNHETNKALQPRFVGEFGTDADVLVKVNDIKKLNHTYATVDEMPVVPEKGKVSPVTSVELHMNGENLIITGTGNVAIREPKPNPKEDTKEDTKENTGTGDAERMTPERIIEFVTNMLKINSTQEVGRYVPGDAETFMKPGSEQRGNNLKFAFWVGHPQQPVLGLSLTYTSCHSVLVLCHPLENPEQNKSIIFAKCATSGDVEDAILDIQTQIGWRKSMVPADLKHAIESSKIPEFEWIKTGGKGLTGPINPIFVPGQMPDPTGYL